MKFPAAALLFIALAGPAAAQSPFEDLARTTALTAADDYRIGKGYVDMATWMWGVQDDPAVVAPIDAMVRRIVAASDRPDMVFNLFITSDPSVNASALPGGFLLINQGLIDLLPPEQLAFVIAHEISHVQLRHFATSMNMNRALQVIETGVQQRAAGEPGEEAQRAWSELATMSSTYSRQLELEADLYGMLYALRAGYPLGAGVASMQTMLAVLGEQPDYLAQESTHPSFSTRIEQLQLGQETIRETYKLFDAGVAYCRGDAWDAGIAAFQQFLTLFPHSAGGWSNLGTCYLHKAFASMPADPWWDDLPLYARPDMALGTLREGVDRVSVERARDAFARALAIDPNRDAALNNLGVLARRTGDFKGAEALLNLAHEIDPDYAGYCNNLGVLAAADGKWKPAERWFAKALAADAGYVPAVVNRASALQARGKKKAAIAAWEQALTSPRAAERAWAALVDLGAREGSPPQPEPPGTSAVAATSSLGPVSLGQGLDEVKAALGVPEFEDRFDDGYYAYLAWPDQGLSAVFLDGVASSFEVGAPSELRTPQGIGLGSTAVDIRGAYGEPDDGGVEGGEALLYNQLGRGFFCASDGAVVAFSMWQP